MAMAAPNREPEGYEPITAALRALADPARAAIDKAYHKSPWEHWGVAAPTMERVIRDRLADLGADGSLRLAARLWREPVWDLKIVAGRLLTRRAVAPGAELWTFVTRRMADLDGWALADTLASVGSRCCLADPARLDDVELWVENPHLWTRRASLVFTLPWTKGAGRDPERMLGWARRLAPDREWFIQKAIGWWLRELAKRDAPRVRRFLADDGGLLRAVARREATKYLDGFPRRRSAAAPRAAEPGATS
jgi:3-methyladenine DNA glycosylase AlkD